MGVWNKSWLYLQQGPAAGCLIMGRCLCLWGPGGLALVCVGSSSGQEAWEESHCCLPPTAPPRLLLGVWGVAVWMSTVATPAKLFLCVFPKMIHRSTGHQTTISSFKRLYNFLVKLFKDIHAITGRDLPQVLSEMVLSHSPVHLGLLPILQMRILRLREVT